MLLLTYDLMDVLIRNPEIDKVPFKDYKGFYRKNVYKILELFYYGIASGYHMKSYFNNMGYNYDKIITYYLDSNFVSEQRKKLSRINRSEGNKRGAAKAVASGKCIFLRKNLKRDSRGRSISHTKGNLTKIKRGSSHILSRNLVRDGNNKSLLHLKVSRTRLSHGPYVTHQSRETALNTSEKRFGTRASGGGYWKRTKYNQDPMDKKHYLSDGAIYVHNRELYKRSYENGKILGPKMWLKMVHSMNRPGKCAGAHSYPEDLLGDLLFLLNIHYIREYQVVIDGNVRYIADYYLPDYNVILECDGEWKYKNGILGEHYRKRARLIEQELHLSVHNIPSQVIVKQFLKDKKKLYNLVISNKYPMEIYHG